MFDISKLNLPAPPDDPKRPGFFSAPIPGESLTQPPGKFPYERAPRFADPEEALRFIFERLIQWRQAAQMLAYLEAGLPVTTLVELICQSGASEGLWSIPMSYVMAPPITVILMRMAQAAGIEPIMHSSQLVPEKADQMMLKLAEARISSNQVDKAQKAGEKSKNDLADDGAKVRILDTKGFV